MAHEILVVDEKWSIAYSPEENDRPLYWLRYGETHRGWPENNAVTALFFALLEAKTNANP